QDDVGTMRHRGEDRLTPIGGLRHHLDVGGVFEEGTEPRPHQSLVVRDEDPDRIALVGTGHEAGSIGSAGSHARTTNPPASPGDASKRPPTDSTRSRIPWRP